MVKSAEEYRVVFYHKAFYVMFCLALTAVFGIMITIIFLLSLLFQMVPPDAGISFLFGGWFGSAIISILTSLVAEPKIENTRTKIYRYLWRKYCTENTSPLARKAILQLINVISRTEYAPTNDQTKVTNKIVAISSNEKRTNSQHKIIVIEGAAGCGKTKAIEITLHSLCTQEAYADYFKKYGKQIFYFNFADRTILSQSVANGFAAKKFCGALLILDNVHFLPIGDEAFHAIVKSTYDNTPGAPDVLVIIARDTNIDIPKSMHKYIDESACFQLNDIPQVSWFDSSLCPERTEQILANVPSKNFDEEDAADIRCFKAHIHRMQALYIKESNNCFFEIQSILLGEQLADPIFQKNLIIVVCCFVFTGNCRADLIEKALASITQVSHSSFLRNLEKCGLLSSFANMKTARFAFHQLSARVFLQQLVTKNDEALAFTKEVFRTLATTVSDRYLRWCYTIPNNPKHAEEMLRILMNKRACSYTTMKESLDFVTELFSLRGLSIALMQVRLSDRLGMDGEGRKAALRAYQKSSQAEVLFLLLFCDHEAFFDSEFSAEFEALLESPDSYLRFVANAWHDHIWTHKGQWNFDQFLDRTSNITYELEAIEQQAYDKQELLRRCYCDCYRVYYLQGSCDWSTYASIESKLAPLKNALAASMGKEFEDFESKFVHAHVIHYDMLFKAGCLGDKLSLDEQAFLERIIKKYKIKVDYSYELCPDYARQKQLLKKVALSIYLKAYRSFQENGDKTAMYVALRICELDPFMAKNGWDFKKRCIKPSYEPTTDEILLSQIDQDTYDCVFEFYHSFEVTEGVDQDMYEFAAFARTYMLKFAATAFFDLPNTSVTTSDVVEFGEKALEYHRQFHKIEKNHYAEVRIKLLAAIFKYEHNLIQKSDFSRQLEKIAQECTKRNYQREARLIAAIRNTKYAADREAFRKIYLYYPIVLQ